MSKYLKTKKGSLESAVLEAVSPAQQAAIAISKKQKAGKPGYDKEGKSLKDDMTVEDKEAYEKFFKSALKKFKVDSPADFKSDEEKKKFFDYIDENYKAENEEAELEEGYSPKEIKMAIGVASDPRYKGGNMTGAVKAIDKIKKGLSDHPQVAAVLKRQNESLAEKAARAITDMWKESAKSKEEEKKVKEEEEDEKDPKMTMTGKPAAKIEVNPKSKTEEK